MHPYASTVYLFFIHSVLSQACFAQGWKSSIHLFKSVWQHLIARHIKVIKREKTGFEPMAVNFKIEI